MCSFKKVRAISICTTQIKVTKSFLHIFQETDFFHKKNYLAKFFFSWNGLLLLFFVGQSNLFLNKLWEEYVISKERKSLFGKITLFSIIHKCHLRKFSREERQNLVLRKKKSHFLTSPNFQSDTSWILYDRQTILETESQNMFQDSIFWLVMY